MKRTLRTIFALALGGLLLTYPGCKSSHHAAEPITDQQIDKLNGKTFKVTQVLFGQTTSSQSDHTSEYTTPALSAPFQITITGTHGSTTLNYTTTNRPPSSPWEASGTLVFDTTDPQTEVMRDDGVAVTYSLTATTSAPITSTLIMSFLFNSTDGYPARTANVQGNWTFKFSAN